MAKITYTNKVALNPQPSIADENKVTDSDMNEIKSSVNTLYDNQGDLSSLQTTTKTDLVSAINETITYSTTEQRIGTWINGKPLYRKVIKYTGNISDGMDINYDISNVDYMDIKSAVYDATNQSNVRFQFKPYYLSTTDYFFIYFRDNKLRLRIGSISIPYTLNQLIIELEYTKTTD